MTGTAVRPNPPVLAMVAVLAFLGSVVAPRVVATAARGSGPVNIHSAAPFDLDAVVRRVSHHPRPVDGRPGTLRSVDDAYELTFDHEGFALAAKGEAARIDVVRVGRSEAVQLDPQPWVAGDQTGTRRLSEAVEERVHVRSGEIEWDVVLHEPLPGDGSVSVTALVRGLDGATVHDDHLTLQVGGTSFRMGQLVVRDATGRELHRVVPTVRGDRLELSVPAAALIGARYPVVLDPTVTPPRVVSGAPLTSSETAPVSASNGTDHLVVWEDNRSGNGDIFGARVASDGRVLDPAGIDIGQNNVVHEADPTVIFDGTNYVVAWSAQFDGWDSGYTVVTPAGVADAPSPIAWGTGNQRNPVLSRNPSGVMAVWEDDTSGSVDIHARYLHQFGNSPIVVASGPGSQAQPGISWDGSNHLVTWLAGTGASARVMARRLTPTGALPDVSLPVSGLTLPEDRPVVAFDGTNHLVVWQELNSTSSWDIRAAHISPALERVGPSISLSAAPDQQVQPAIAAGAGRAVVAWQDFRSGSTWDVYARKVKSDGSTSAQVPLATGSPTQQQVAVSVAGNQFLAVWQDLRAGGSWDIRGSRLSNALALQDDPSLLVSTRVVNQTRPAVAFDGTNHLVVWSDDRNASTNSSDLWATRVRPNGEILDPGGLRISSSTDADVFPAVAFDGTRFLVVWSQDPSGAFNSEIFGQRVNLDGTLFGTAFDVSQGASDQSEPALASDGTNLLVVWGDRRGGTADIYARRVGPTGAPLGTPFPVSSGSWSESAPSTSFDGTNFLVVWTDNRSGSFDIYGARVNTSVSTPSVLDASGIPIGTGTAGQFRADVAFGGGHHLVAWYSDGDIVGARVSPAGAVVGSSIPLSTAPDTQDEPTVAFNGDFLVAWADRRSGVDYDIFATRVGTDGSVKDANGFLAAGGAGDQFSPDATPGSSWMLVHTWQRSGGSVIAADKVSPK